jgi:NAD(P)-dependent dehydrogenase (short-subunit alcohol dehydrogenase family)
VRNPFSLEGKNILVTGASSGLGRQIAISCSRIGARLVLTGRHQGRLSETLCMLQGEGHREIAGDLAQTEDIHRIADAAGPLHGVVHNAGIQRLTPIKLVSEKSLYESTSINYFAPILLTQRLLYRDSIDTGGSIVFMASTAAHIGTPGVGLYSSQKAALLGLVRCLALEQAKRRVRVNCLSPSAVETPIWDVAQLEQQRARHPLGLGTPDDVANATIYLLSDASRWVTGTTLVMDGGAM